MKKKKKQAKCSLSFNGCRMSVHVIVFIHTRHDKDLIKEIRREGEDKNYGKQCQTERQTNDLIGFRFNNREKIQFARKDVLFVSSGKRCTDEQLVWWLSFCLHSFNRY